MISDENNDQNVIEVFDIERLIEIAELSKAYAENDNKKNVPDSNFSDFECTIWQLMNHLISFGRELEKKEKA